MLREVTLLPGKLRDDPGRNKGQGSLRKVESLKHIRCARGQKPADWSACRADTSTYSS